MEEMQCTGRSILELDGGIFAFAFHSDVLVGGGRCIFISPLTEHRRRQHSLFRKLTSDECASKHDKRTARNT
jgi:hypothetical protein